MFTQAGPKVGRNPGRGQRQKKGSVGIQACAFSLVPFMGCKHELPYAEETNYLSFSKKNHIFN